MRKIKIPKKDVKYYLGLPWTYTVETESYEGSSYYIIRVNELPGICTDCENIDEGMEDIRDLITNVVEIYKEKGEPVPEPINKDEYKGKILYRTDSYRHYLIAKTSKRMHKSISKTLDSLVDMGLKSFSAV